MLTKMVLWTDDRPVFTGGMILSEILIAGAVLSIALASTAVLLGNLQVISINEQNAFNATLLAKQTLAEARLANFDDLFSFNNTKEISGIAFNTNFSVFYRNAFTADITADVSWLQGQAQKHIVFSDEIVDWKNSSNFQSCDWLDGATGHIAPVASAVLDIDSSGVITDIAVNDDYAYVSVDDTVASSSDLYVLDIKDSLNPKIVSFLNTGPGIASIVVSGGYVFAANAGSYEMQIINVSNPAKPVLVSQAKLPGVSVQGGAGFGRSIAYFDHKIYIGLVKASGPEFHIIDISYPEAPIALGSYEIDSTVNSISVQRGYAVLGTPGAQSVVVLDITNPSSIKLVGQSTLIGWQTQGVSAVAILGSQIYVGRTLGGFYSPNPELLLFRRNDLASAQNNLAVGASVDDLIVYGDYIYLATSDASKAFEVVYKGDLFGMPDVIMTEAFPFRAIAIACNDTAMYVVTQNGHDFLHIFSPPS